ncbi:TM2 domain-containing protein [Porphyromonas catoniae]|jgi:TM2 domain protein|uniref:TM2 domain-containing protein n=1 Tax=Porphyromonas catoniae TaxID=41976 RepID=UPI0028D7F6AA|nr:TM2 domain-containing protein [Porphyromonas catoniae]
MDSQKVDLFILTNQKYFEPAQLQLIRERLQTVDEAKFLALSSIEYKDPSMMLLVSIFAGTLGIDRFMVGDTGLGVAKLLTGGGCGIFTLIDWFQIQGVTKRKNFESLMQVLNY